MNDACATCRFWLDKPTNPTCRRFPRYEIHGANDWCGEYQPVVVAHEMEPVPVVTHEAPKHETQTAFPVKQPDNSQATVNQKPALIKTVNRKGRK